MRLYRTNIVLGNSFKTDGDFSRCYSPLVVDRSEYGWKVGRSVRSAARGMKPTNSLERVLAVLDVFSEDRLEWMPDDLMKELGYSRPTFYRYLKTLKDAGFLMSSRNAGITLGPRVVEMDYLTRRADALVLSGLPFLKELTGSYACTAMLLRWYGNKILCVVSETSTPDPISSYPRGRPMPLGRGAIARSIMAFLPRQQLLPLIARNLEDLRSVGLGSTTEEVLTNLKKVRRAGFAIAHGEVTPGAVGIAAPVFDERRNPIASVCVTIAGNLVTGADIDEMGPKVRSIALQMSAQNASPRDSKKL